MREITINEVDQVSGGIIAVILISFGAGYAVGTGIYQTYCALAY